MKLVLEAAGHWWMPGRCYSWWTQSWRGPKVSGLLPASGEEAGCRQWRALDCKHSLLLLIQRDVAGVRESKVGREERKRDLKHPSYPLLGLFGRTHKILISLGNEQQTHFTYIML